MYDEAKIIDKLRRIEALFAGAKTEGERTAAESAIERIKERLKDIRKTDPPVEYKFTLSDMWSRKLLVALLRRYGIHPYRYYRQRYTTVMASISKSFVDETLWPEFQELNKTLRSYLDDITNRVITEGIYSDNSEPEIKQRSIEYTD